jgi:hypothetical protein
MFDGETAETAVESGFDSTFGQVVPGHSGAQGRR